jgi:GNAT superfamily N-acetyltransferase
MIHSFLSLIALTALFTISVFAHEVDPTLLWKNEEGICAKKLKAEQFCPFLNEIAELEIEIFRDFPYLYEGVLEQDLPYLEMYADSPEGEVVVLLDTTLKTNQVIGFSTSLPLAQSLEEIKKLFPDSALNLQDFLYIGELMIHPSYRGKGLLRRFHQTQYAESNAKEPGFRHLVFATVRRDATHPCAPENYSSLDPLWRNYGYEKMDKLQIEIYWKRVDTGKNELNILDVWKKTLPHEDESPLS